MEMRTVIEKVIRGNDLSIDEAMEAMNMMMEGQCTPTQTASFLTALRMKSETLEEMIGCARVLQEKAEHSPQKLQLH